MGPRMLHLGLALAMVLVVAPPAVAKKATGAYAPYEDVVEVVAMLAWHLDDDVYRFPPPKDVTGHDLYALSFDRLQSWGQRFPSRLPDVTTYASAQALERLREYERAADAYAEVAAMDSPLAEPARTAEARARRFAEAAALPEDGADLEGELAAIKKKLEAYAAVIERYRGTPYESLALVEEERLEARAVDVVVSHRQLVDDGDVTAEQAIRFLIKKHADSHNLPAHVMRLGDLWAERARAYATAHHRPLDFDSEEFSQLADHGLDAYRKIATWDGIPEKPEAQGRFTSLEAYKAAVLERHR